jgi:hypothetical protein
VGWWVGGWWWCWVREWDITPSEWKKNVLVYTNKCCCYIIISSINIDESGD